LFYNGDRGDLSSMSDTSQRLQVLDTSGVLRVFVLGDIHGDLDALNQVVERLTPRDVAVFLGDYADRGPDGLEVLETLMALTAEHPNRFIALKGNHEDFSDDGTPIFYPCTLIDEVERKGRSWRKFFPKYKAFVDRLPIAAVVPGYALLVHGGISSAITTITDLESPSSLIESDILWSDPGNESGQHRSPRGAGKLFGPDISLAVLDGLGVRHVFRSHQPRRASKGPVIEHGTRVVTTSCTSVYGGRAFAMVLPVGRLPEAAQEITACAEFL
jgi:hypothetical protein